MAIDSAEKRKSISGIPFAFHIPGVTPNAVHDQEWRQEASWSYSGFAPAAAATGSDDVITNAGGGTGRQFVQNWGW